jgi:hypothetical protein
VESNVTVENAARKFDLTTVGYSSEGPVSLVRDIRLAGTTLKLLFAASPNAEAVAGSK